MTNHTVGSLMNLLKEFPEDLPVSNEISLIWFYPDEKVYEISEKQEYTQSEFESLTREYSTDLCIFEGSFEKDTIVDQDNTMEKLIRKYEKED